MGGQNQWEIKTIGDLIEGYRDFPHGIQEYVPKYNYLLFDLSQFEDEKIKGTIKLRVCLDILKHIYTLDGGGFELVFEKHVQDLLELAEEQQDIVAYIKTFIKYVLSAREKLPAKKVHDIVNKISTKGGIIVATAADELRKEGKKEGREENKKETAIKLLRLNMNDEQILDVTGLTMEELKQIKKNLES